LDGTGAHPDLVPGHILFHGLILITRLVAGSGLEHPGIAILGCASAALALSIPGFFLDRSIAGYLLLYIQAVACLFANALCLPCCPAAMTEAGARIRSSIAHSAIFLNIVFIPGGWGTTGPGSPFPSNHQQGLSNLFSNGRLHIRLSRHDENDLDLRIEDMNYPAPYLTHMRIPQASSLDFTRRETKKQGRRSKNAMKRGSVSRTMLI